MHYILAFLLDYCMTATYTIIFWFISQYVITLATSMDLNIIASHCECFVDFSQSLFKMIFQFMISQRKNFSKEKDKGNISCNAYYYN